MTSDKAHHSVGDCEGEKEVMVRMEGDGEGDGEEGREESEKDGAKCCGKHCTKHCAH